MTGGLGDVGGPGQPVEVQHQVPERGHHAGCGPGADLAGVFGEGDVAGGGRPLSLTVELCC